MLQDKNGVICWFGHLNTGSGTSTMLLYHQQEFQQPEKEKDRNIWDETSFQWHLPNFTDTKTYFFLTFNFLKLGWIF